MDIGRGREFEERTSRERERKRKREREKKRDIDRNSAYKGRGLKRVHIFVCLRCIYLQARRRVR
jgi:hypothetical protein